MSFLIQNEQCVCVCLCAEAMSVDNFNRKHMPEDETDVRSAPQGLREWDIGTELEEDDTKTRVGDGQ